MPSYLVEMYVPRACRGDADAFGRRTRIAAEQMSRRGVSIRLVRTTEVPDDETCFQLVEAPSAADVSELCRLAELGHVRIVPAIET